MREKKKNHRREKKKKKRRLPISRTFNTNSIYLGFGRRKKGGEKKENAGKKKKKKEGQVGPKSVHPCLRNRSVYLCGSGRGKGKNLKKKKKKKKKKGEAERNKGPATSCSGATVRLIPGPGKFQKRKGRIRSPRPLSVPYTQGEKGGGSCKKKKERGKAPVAGCSDRGPRWILGKRKKSLRGKKKKGQELP